VKQIFSLVHSQNGAFYSIFSDETFPLIKNKKIFNWKNFKDDLEGFNVRPIVETL